MHRWLDTWMNTYTLKGCWRFCSCLNPSWSWWVQHRCNYSAFMTGRGQWSLTRLSASLQKRSPPDQSWLKQNQTRTVVPWPKPAAQEQREECVDMGSIPLDKSGAKNMTSSGGSVAKYSIKLEIYAPHPQFPGTFGQNISGAKIFQISTSTVNSYLYDHFFVCIGEMDDTSSRLKPFHRTFSPRKFYITIKVKRLNSST